jgi:nucleotide-binding universal stress UspA family protein
MTRAAPVIVGYDGSPDANRALAWAADFARDNDSPVRLVTATGDVRIRQVTELDQEWERSHVSGLTEDARAAVAATGLDKIELDVVKAAPVPALILDAEHSSLVVVGSRGHGRVASMFVGSVSQHVARYAPCSVVVVRDQADPEATRVVVGVDASTGAEPALELAFDYAALKHLPVAAVHVLESMAPGPPYASRYVGDRHAGEISKVEPVIRESVGRHVDKFPEVEVRHEIVVGTVGRVLSDASEHAVLLVVGSRGRGAFASMLLGSVGQSVLQHARCPVVIAR